MKEKTDFLKKLGIVLCFLAIVIMALIFVFSFEHRAMRDTCEKYYDSLEYKRYAEAYNYLSESYKNKISLQDYSDDYTAALSELEEDLGESIKYDCKISSENRKENAAEILLELKTYGKKDNIREIISIVLVKENGRWKIDNITKND